MNGGRGALSTRNWNVLVVDDDQDIHLVTRLALKHRKWKKRGFTLHSATSAADARAFLEKSDAPPIHAAIVDVVMETSTAGLELCKYLRARFDSSLRIVLRTGQPGAAPEEVVLNEYDIDYYLAKPDATAERLFSVVRACLRSSLDISTLLAFGRQLQSFAHALRNVSELRDLLVLMGEGLRFLELKYGARTVFVHSFTEPPYVRDDNPLPLRSSLDDVRAAVVRAHDERLATLTLARAPGLDVGAFVMPFDVGDGGDNDTRGALYAEVAPEFADDAFAADFAADARLFVENWKMAFATLHLQERVARERMLREQMYLERTRSIANMVTGVAHEINTPLGVANTANSMIVSLTSRLRTLSDAEETAETLSDIREACELMERNIVRAHRLIESFKKLSAGQLSDHRMSIDLVAAVDDCVATMTPVTKKQRHVITVHREPGADLRWDGYPGHLSQVIINLIQNTVRYGYPDREGGQIDIRVGVTPRSNDASLRIDYEDYGHGIAPEIFPQLFQPFVTSGRDRGGTGLGLAITHNIVTNILRGSIDCTSTAGKGTRFVIDVPRRVPEPRAAEPSEP